MKLNLDFIFDLKQFYFIFTVILIFFYILENKMSSMNKIDQESLAVMELSNRQLRQDLTLALILISNKKQTFNNLDKYEEKKRVLSEQNQQLMVKWLLGIVSFTFVNDTFTFVYILYF